MSIGECMLYNLELTECTRPFTALTRKTIQLVSEFDLRSHVLCSSFNPLELLLASQAIGADRLALLQAGDTPGFLRLMARFITPHRTYHPHVSLVSAQMTRRFRRSKLRVNVWTVNLEDRMRELLEWGINGLITDLPARAVKVREDYLIG